MLFAGIRDTSAKANRAWRAQCRCRDCHYIGGGGPNTFMLMPAEGFRSLSGEPRTFARSDLKRE